MKRDSILTVFTPTFNRKHTLERTHQSLCAQTCKAFVWLIVDDGSSDGTAQLVAQWQKKDNGFQIEYIYKTNEGMHTAHNIAYEHIHTELSTCIDSDDWMPDDAVEKICEKWKQVAHLGYAGLIGLDISSDGKVVGTGFPEGMTETTLSGYYANGGKGDKKLVYRTDIIKQYPPYPVYSGEKYVALAYKYLLIDQDYKLSVLDEAICCVEYQADGHSHGMWKEYMRSPRGFALWRKTCMQYPQNGIRLLLDCIHYVSSSLLAKDYRFIQESPRKGLTIFCIPFGILLTMLVKKKNA